MTTTIDKYTDLVHQSTAAATADAAGRLLHKVTEHDPSLRDAVATVMALLVDSHWGDDNELADGIVQGFTYPDLLAAAERHDDRNPRVDA